MQENKKTPIIESIREYVKSYPGINNRKINIDYLGDGMEYSIDPIGADPIYKKYVDGSCLKQFQFALTSKEAYDGDARTGIANSGFYQDFEEWTQQNNSVFCHIPFTSAYNHFCIYMVSRIPESIHF